MVQKYSKTNENLAVVLTGKRRQYIINELQKLNIKYYYFEMTTFKELNELYNILDLYIVASRVEGGPQAIFECAITKNSNNFYRCWDSKRDLSNRITL